MLVYEYNKQFQKLARFAKQDVPDEKSMIYQFRGGLREDLQLDLLLFEPTKYDEFYNMALKQEAAQLKCNASKKRVRDATPSSSTQVATKQQKYWLPPPPPFRQPYQEKSKGGNGSSHPPNLGYQNKALSHAPRSSLLITVRSQRLLATSDSRKGTMQTNASTKGAFRLLLL